MAESSYSASVKETAKTSVDDLKRIEYQNKLLNSKAKSDETSCSATSSLVESCSQQKQIEERKKEILKRFGIEQTTNASSKKSSIASSSLASSAKQLNANSMPHLAAGGGDDKNTVCSGDSGFASGLVTSSNYFNMNYRPQLNKQQHTWVIIFSNANPQKNIYAQSFCSGN